MPIVVTGASQLEEAVLEGHGEPVAVEIAKVDERQTEFGAVAGCTPGVSMGDAKVVEPEVVVEATQQRFAREAEAPKKA